MWVFFFKRDRARAVPVEAHGTDPPLLRPASPGGGRRCWRAPLHPSPQHRPGPALRRPRARRGHTGEPEACGSRHDSLPLQRAPGRVEAQARCPHSAGTVATDSPLRPGASFRHGATASRGRYRAIATKLSGGAETERGREGPGEGGRATPPPPRLSPQPQPPPPQERRAGHRLAAGVLLPLPASLLIG